MSQNETEESYSQLFQSLEILAKALDAPFLESYLESIANLLDQHVQVVDNLPNKADETTLLNIYQKVQEKNLSSEAKRKVSQLLLLKASMEDKLSPNHQLTPDAIGFLFVFLLDHFLKGKKEVTLLDPAVGMGNLLATVMNGLTLSEKKVSGYGVENDDLLIEIAAANSEWFQQDTRFFHQDALQSILLDPVDAVISDLPVGYYPNDEKAHEFEVGKNVAEGHVFAHHLMIETSFNYLKPAGFGLYLVPTKLFESEQGPELLTWLKKESYIQGMITLPKALFLNEASQKSILILQKPGENAKQAKEVLLAQLGSIKDQQEVKNFFQQFTLWQLENLNE